MVCFILYMVGRLSTDARDTIQVDSTFEACWAKLISCAVQEVNFIKIIDR
jgi:hypothetical protein